MKKYASALLALLMCAMLLFGCGTAGQSTDATADTGTTSTEAAGTDTTEATTQIANPIHDVADYSELLSAVPGVLMSNAPIGSTNATYSYIDGTPVIAQINFTLDGHEYTYRGAAVANGAMVDISGVNEAFDKTETLTVPNIDELEGGTYTLAYSTSNSSGLATWYYAPNECQYSIYTPTGCDISQGIISVVKSVMPIAAYAIDITEPTGTVQGATVLSLNDGELVVNTAEGATIQFELNALMGQGIQVGDVVDISYYGDLANWPLVLSIVVSATPATPVTNQVSGTVYSYTATSVFVSTDSGMVYGFVLNSDTKYTGQSTTLKKGNSVTVTFSGSDLETNVVALSIETTAVASGADTNPDSGSGSGDSSLENKRLKGYVTYYNGSSISIMTGAGHEFTFRITSLTYIYSEYNLGVGSRVRITYDGYASDSPVAKKIEVYSDADPTPTSHTMNGYLLSFDGNTILISTDSGNQHSFTITSSTSIIGSGVTGAPVQITYTGTEDGSKVAVRILFT